MGIKITKTDHSATFEPLRHMAGLTWKIDAAVPTARVRPEASSGPTATSAAPCSRIVLEAGGSRKRKNECGKAFAARSPAGGGGSVPLDVLAKHSRMHAMTITHSASTLGFSHAYDEVCLKAAAMLPPSPRSPKRRLNLRREAGRQTQWIKRKCSRWELHFVY